MNMPLLNRVYMSKMFGPEVMVVTKDLLNTPNGPQVLAKLYDSKAHKPDNGGFIWFGVSSFLTNYELQEE